MVLVASVAFCFWAAPSRLALGRAISFASVVFWPNLSGIYKSEGRCIVF